MTYKNIVDKSIANFDFDFLFSDKHQQDESNSATLIVTDNQYILSLNGEDGSTFRHLDTIAMILSEVFNESFNMKDMYDSLRLYEKYLDKVIYARIWNDINGCGILLDLSKLESISPKQYIHFKNFYNKYNNKIIGLSKSVDKERLVLNKFVRFLDKNNIDHECNDFSELLEYLKTIVDSKKRINMNENILDKVEEDIYSGIKM